ncbi:receptor-type tyrosine-protein phosphatase eta isoform X2 [Cheilinus undulatus]|uniref:receptor-type tyrosine-protein phosphatase eta isoform X2 n=1 Tax=Cheilinus undulatus TaxID=241271 RepID=UPI001BD266AC|nr:receptor-type tyrosine-protein phosphatase eta isoform X2 [Cheilinus undulatus]
MEEGRALLLTYCAAEREYFYPSKNFSWDDARRYCQVCFADLVTLTPQNIQNITKNIISDSWIGLRKNLSNSETISNADFNSTSNHSTSMLWSGWANGDPLSFQNWYPGWPVFKSPPLKRDCCSCSCTCPSKATERWTTPFPSFTTQNMTEYTTGNVTEYATGNVTEYATGNVTGDTTGKVKGMPSSFTATPDQNVTDVSRLSGFATENVTNFSSPMNVTTTTPPTTTVLPLEAQCVSSPMPTPDIPEIDENYIEDSCVALLSFGAWIEKHCFESLPFVCFEERFVGQVNVTNVTSSSAVLEWLEGPGNISHYYLEVEDQEPVDMGTNLTYDLRNLTAGTLHHVKVFPVKCGRKLGPQMTSFYTIPNRVENLKVTHRTEKNVSLSWDKPDGNVESYIIRWENGQTIRDKADVVVGDLIPGGLYTFAIVSGVSGRNITSEETWITTYTKPGKVSDLKVNNPETTSLQLTWSPPSGNTSGYSVITKIGGNSSPAEMVKETKFNKTDLPMGVNITFHVTALANDSLKGDAETVSSYTRPGQISNLRLLTLQDSLKATWSPPEGNYSSFHVTLHCDGCEANKTDILTEKHIEYKGLKTAANYTLIVYTISGGQKSQSVQKSAFTLPAPPTNLTITCSDENTISIKWTPPANTAFVTYSVTISSTFWGEHRSETIEDKTSYTFGGLKSGTNYSISVKTVAGDRTSWPVNETYLTDPNITEVSLSMLCSSEEMLLCDKTTTRENVFLQLEKHFKNKFGNDIFWKLMKSET